MRIPISQEPVSSEEGEGAPCSWQRSERAPAEVRAQAASPRPSVLARGVRSAARPGPAAGGTGMVFEGEDRRRSPSIHAFHAIVGLG